MHKNIIKFVLSAFGIGFIPFAPGTWASLAALCAVWGLSLFDALPVADLIVFFVILLVTATLISYYQKLEYQAERDPSFIVMDEVLGIFVTFMALPITWVTALIGFVAFRFFDIIKPLGIKNVEKMEGPWGIILDDLLAGLFAHIILVAYIFFGGPLG